MPCGRECVVVTGKPAINRRVDYYCIQPTNKKSRRFLRVTAVPSINSFILLRGWLGRIVHENVSRGVIYSRRYNDDRVGVVKVRWEFT